MLQWRFHGTARFSNKHTLNMNIFKSFCNYFPKIFRNHLTYFDFDIIEEEQDGRSKRWENSSWRLHYLIPILMNVYILIQWAFVLFQCNLKPLNCPEMETSFYRKIFPRVLWAEADVILATAITMCLSIFVFMIKQIPVPSKRFIMYVKFDQNKNVKIIEDKFGNIGIF